MTSLDLKIFTAFTFLMLLKIPISWHCGPQAQILLPLKFRAQFNTTTTATTTTTTTAITTSIKVLT